MDILTFKKVAPTLLKYDIVPYLHGSMGLGKTQVVKQLAAEMGVSFQALYPATQADVGDMLGLLKDNGDGTVSHSRPDWFPTEGAGILFIDEINRAHPDLIQAMFSLVNGKTIHKHTLPPNWHVVVAGNYQNNNFITTNTQDDAWNSRFCHIDFKPTPAEFVDFATTREAHSIAAFIRDQPLLLNSLTGKNHKGLEYDEICKPTNRTWLEFVAPLESENLTKAERMEIYSGLVGRAAAAAKITHGEKLDKSLSIYDILERYPQIQTRVLDYSVSEKGEARFDLLNSSTEELMLLIKKDVEFLKRKDCYIPNLKQFFLDMPLELAQKVFKGMEQHGHFYGRDNFINDREYVDKVVNNNGRRTDGAIPLNKKWTKAKK